MTALVQRLAEQPEVAAVTFSERIPGSSEWRSSIEAERNDAAGAAASQERFGLIRSRVNMVAPNLFDVFDVRVVGGRTFVATDALALILTIVPQGSEAQPR